MQDNDPRKALHLEGTVQLAIRQQQAGDLASAEELYGRVLREQPHHAVCLHNLGSIRLQRGDATAALDLLAAASRLKPREALFLCSLGAARRATGDASGAAQACREALRLRPGYMQAWSHLAGALQDLGQPEAAIDAWRQALAADPQARAARLNLASLLREQQRLDDAEALYEEGLAQNPLDADCAVQVGVMRLARADSSGWQLYAQRHASPEWLKLDRPSLIPLPQWEGEVLEKGALLLHGEQGIGDEIMFSTLVAAASARAARTELLCEPRLVPLFARSFPGVRVVPRPAHGEPPAIPADSDLAARCSTASLPLLLQTSPQSLGGAPWLKADPAAVAAMRVRLAAAGVHTWIGISWRGGANSRTRATRSLDLASLAPLFAVPGVGFIDVQYGDHAAEIAAFHGASAARLHRLDGVDALRDMDGFAALLGALDGVISVDNSTIHLAAALGTPTWMLCPRGANWRWGLQGERSPWYQTLRLFRQRPEEEGWDGVVQRLQEALQASPPMRASLPPALPPPPPALLPQPPPTALLVNDTSGWSHWGCAGTTLALHEGLRAAGHVTDALAITQVSSLGPLPRRPEDLHDDRLFDAFCARNPDVVRRLQRVHEVVINGEGCLHGVGPTALSLLYLAWIARRRFGKRTSIINHSCHPAPAAAEPLYALVYAAMDHVAVREASSAATLARLGITAVQAFDCLPLFIAAHAPLPRPPERRVVLAGGMPPSPALIHLLTMLAERVLAQGYTLEVLMGASAYPAGEDVQLMAGLHPRLRGRYRLVNATSERQWLSCLAGASLLVSGRFHHSTAAACLGTPIAVTGSGPEDMEGLIDRLGLQRDAVWIDAATPDAAAARVDALLKDPAPARVSPDRLAWLRRMAQHNFDGCTAPR